MLREAMESQERSLCIEHTRKKDLRGKTERISRKGKDRRKVPLPMGREVVLTEGGRKTAISRRVGDVDAFQKGKKAYHVQEKKKVASHAPRSSRQPWGGRGGGCTCRLRLRSGSSSPGLKARGNDALDGKGEELYVR